MLILLNIFISLMRVDVTMKKRFYSLKLKLGIIVIILMALILSVNLVITIEQIKKLNEESYGREALFIVKSTKNSIDADKFEKLVENKNINDPYYENLRKYL
jgi:predicted RND superfamily exporter protein